MNSPTVYHRGMALITELKEQKRLDDALAVATSLQVFLDIIPADEGGSRIFVFKECEQLSALIRKGGR
jgi:hypothetical protein